MKLLQVNKLYYPWIGGVEQIVRDIAEGLQGSDDLAVEVLACQPRGAGATESIHGVKVYKATSWGMVMSMPVSWQFLFLFRRLVQECDVLLLHHPFPSGFLAYILFGRGKKIAVWYHSDIVRQRAAGFILRPLVRYVLRRAAVIFVSSHNLINHSRVLGEFREKCQVIYFGVDLPRFQATPEVTRQAREIRVRYGAPLVLSVGRLAHYKGFEYLIAAARQIRGRIVIVGQGQLHAALVEHIRKCEVVGKVFIVSGVANVAPYYHACDVFVLPSISPAEAFGIVQAEAMAAGKPVVNTSLPSGVPEVSVHGKTGLTVVPKDSAALAEAVNYLLDNPVERERYGRAAYRRARENFSREKFLTELAAALRRI